MKRPRVHPTLSPALNTNFVIHAGIGIDDMFVIVQCLRNIESDPKHPTDMDPKRKMGLTLKNAGVAITLTSVIDYSFNLFN